MPSPVEMSDNGLGNEGGEGHDHDVEDGEEAVMEIHEIEKEPKDSKKVKRCSACRRMVFGHKGIFGKKCNLERIEDDEELEKDDQAKNEVRKKKRAIIKKVKKIEDETKKLTEEKEKAAERLKAIKAKNKEENEAEERKLKIQKETEEMEKEIRIEEEKQKKIVDRKEKDKKRKEAKQVDEEKEKNRYKGHDQQECKENDDQSRRKDGSRPRRESSRQMESRTRQKSSRKLDRSRRSSSRGYSEHGRNVSRRMEHRPERENPRRNESRRSHSRRSGRDYSRRMENRSKRSISRHSDLISRPKESSRIPRNESRGMDNFQESFANSVVDAISKINENGDRGKEPPPAWEKTISFSGWRRSVEVWAESNLKPSKKANLLLENLKKDVDHCGLKEMIIQEVIENEDFDYKNEDVVKEILDKIEAFVEESKWTKNVKLAKELLEFKQKSDEDPIKYVIRFTALEAKLKNEKVQMSNMFKTGILLNQSNMSRPEKSYVMTSLDMNNESEVLDKVKKKIRENYAVNKESKDVFVATKEAENEPKETLYGNYQGRKEDNNQRNSYREKSRDRTFNRSSSRGRFRNEYRSHSRGRHESRNRREGSSFQGRDRREGSKFNQKDGKSSAENRPQRTYKVEKINFDIDKSLFENEIENKMLIDSGCPEMVCGEQWLNTYESSCSRKFPTVGKEDHFKLGNETFKTIKTVKIPFKVGKLEEELEVGVVEANIPMLLSKSKLKEWGVKIDFLENTMFIRKTSEVIKLKETAQGHLTFPMGKNIKDNEEEIVKRIHLVRIKKKYSMRDLKKIHRVFGHPTTEKVSKLMKDAGEDDPVIIKILKKIHEHCSVCRKHRKNPSKPKVGLPKAREVNEIVCIDLKPVATLINKEDRRQVVYMVDSFSNYTNAGISKSKEAESVAEVILRKWCLGGGGLGYPTRGFFCDNGTEFRKDYLEEISRRLDIKIQLTPSYSPWSNGGCERRHGAIDLTVKKLMDDDDVLKLDEALEHGLWARNMEIGRHGLSPYQVVFGKSPVLPGIMEGTPMTDSLITQADAVRLHFRRQESARQELRKYDSSRRLKDALKARIQPYYDAKYQEGDLIIYQDGNDQWTGPAEVKTMDSKTLFVIHNGQLKKVASCRARPWIEDSEVESGNSDDEEVLVETSLTDVLEIEEDSATGLEEEVNQDEIRMEQSTGMDTELDMENVKTRPKRGSTVIFQKVGENVKSIGMVKFVGKASGNKKNTCWIETDGKLSEIDFMKHVSGWTYNTESPKVQFKETHVMEFNKEEENQERPQSSKWMENPEGSQPSKRLENKMDAEGVFYLTRNSQPKEVFAAVIPTSQYKNPEVEGAMQDELNKWVLFDAYEIVKDEGQEAIDTRWNVLKKEGHDGLKMDIKAKLCLRGFKETDKPRSDSPTVDRISNKILYTIAGNEGWGIECIDVTSAFLQGEELDRSLFVIPPKEANMPGFLWRMKKAAYGLNDASRRWWIKVIMFLKELGGKTLIGDESFIYFQKDGRLFGFISLHVDDFQGSGTTDFFENVMDNICEKFKISKRERGAFKYTGVNVRQEGKEIIIDQLDYAESLEEIDINPKDDNKRPLTKDEYKKFRGITGKLNWLAEMTRPDLSYDCLDLSCHTKSATIGNMKDANKAIRKAKAYKGEIRYGRIGDLSKIKILGISDASYLKQEEKTKSVMGRMVFLSSLEEDRVAPILWKAKTIPTVCKTVKDAETRAADKCVEDSIYIARCIKEVYTGLRGDSQIQVDICTDSQSLVDSLESSKQIDSKLLRPIIKFMKQMLDSKMINIVRWIDTEVCMADILTKPARCALTAKVMDVLRTGNMMDLTWTSKKSKFFIE